MQTPAQLKLLLLDILESAFETGDVHASQQLAVSLSHTVKREGVTVIQNQNVEVYARMMPLMIRALKMCDAFESRAHHSIALQTDSAPAEHLGTASIEDCCAWLFENRIRWQEMQDLMRARYLAHVIGRCATKKEAAGRLGIGNTYLSKLSTPTGAGKQPHIDCAGKGMGLPAT